MAEGGSKALSSDLAGLRDALEKLVELKVKELGLVPKDANASTEVSVDALSRSIVPFTYSPENNQTFDIWFSRYKSTFLEDGEKLQEGARVRLLLRKLDGAAYARYANLLLPIEPATLTFDDNVARLKKLFGKGESQFSIRRRCLQLVMNETDDWATHGGIVNCICEEFNVGTCTADHFRALIFCISIQSDRHVSVRERLLQVLETEEPTKIKLDLLIDEARRHSNAKKDARLDIASAHVSAIRKTRHQGPEGRSERSKFAYRPPQPCYGCGDMHFYKDCSYTSHKCHDCGRTTGTPKPRQRGTSTGRRRARDHL